LELITYYMIYYLLDLEPECRVANLDVHSSDNNIMFRKNIMDRAHKMYFPN
jgi:hypothetical protein